MRLRFRDIPALVRAAKKVRDANVPLTAETILAAYIEDNPPADSLDAIDWESLLAFVERVLPIILALLKII